MDEQEKAELADMIGMFEHPGWTALERQTQLRVDQLQGNMPFSISTIEQLHFARGYMAAMRELLTLRARTLAPPPFDPESE